MAASEAQRRASEKWTAANMKVVSVKVRTELLDAVKAKAAANGESVYSIIKKALEEYVK